MTFTLKEVAAICLFVFGVGGAWGVTIYKIDHFEDRLRHLEGNVQLLLGKYIATQSGTLPDREWVFPDLSRVPETAPDAPDS